MNHRSLPRAAAVFLLIATELFVAIGTHAEPPVPALPSVIATYSLGDYATADALIAALPADVPRPAALALHLRALAAGYPGRVSGLALDSSHRVYVTLKDHSLHLYDDGKTKNASERLESPDVKDIFHDLYPLTNPTDAVPEDFDPGRVRPEAFFKAIYGGSAAEVSRSLVAVDFCGKKVEFTSRNGAAEALKQVSADLGIMLTVHPELKIWVEKLGGTFNWRPIAGTNRLSMHSYGAAIDLNTDKSDYWKWTAPAALKTYSRKAFPTPIIEAFERHGFIWGGKWYHFDTMHFEYRPEVLYVSRNDTR